MSHDIDCLYVHGIDIILKILSLFYVLHLNTSLGLGAVFASKEYPFKNIFACYKHVKKLYLYGL